MQKASTIIIGCGVSGLTCGVRLLEAGFDVTIVAKSVPPNTTSDAAAAIWYPYRAYPEDRVLAWCKKSYETFVQLSTVEQTGVSFTELYEIFIQQIQDPNWVTVVSGFHRLGSDELSPGYVDGYAATVPLMETPIYMPYLMERFAKLGGKIEKLNQEIQNLEDLYADTPLIINCTGIGAGKLCKDPLVFPVRGQVISTLNPGLTRGVVDEVGPMGLTYIIARSKDCILGGTAQENDWNMAVDEETSNDILHRCQQLEPRLRGLEVLGAKVGLRPGRSEIRLEIERATSKCSVIHNYGHGGAGFTLSWGCAEDVLELAKGVFPAITSA